MTGHVLRTACRTAQRSDGCTLAVVRVTVGSTEQSVASANVRLVVVDEQHRPRYLVRAAELEHAILRVAAAAGVNAGDMPGLHGLCVAAAQQAERRLEQAGLPAAADLGDREPAEPTS